MAVILGSVDGVRQREGHPKTWTDSVTNWTTVRHGAK